MKEGIFSIERATPFDRGIADHFLKNSKRNRVVLALVDFSLFISLICAAIGVIAFFLIDILKIFAIASVCAWCCIGLIKVCFLKDWDFRECDSFEYHLIDTYANDYPQIKLYVQNVKASGREWLSNKEFYEISKYRNSTSIQNQLLIDQQAFKENKIKVFK